MDPSNAIDLARTYINAARTNFAIEAAYLFGSYAKGNFHRDSDIDLALKIRGLKDSFEAQVELLKLSASFDSLIEPHPFSNEDFDDPNPLVKEILKTGIQLV